MVEKETKVDIGNWINIVAFFILMASVAICSNTYLVQKDIRQIKEHITIVNE